MPADVRKWKTIHLGIYIFNDSERLKMLKRSMKKISIAMATYNGEKRIKRQLDSIVKQSILPDEIVIVDDCSKDKTIEVIKEYVESYDGITWKILVNEKNLGYKKNFAGTP